MWVINRFQSAPESGIDPELLHGAIFRGAITPKLHWRRVFDFEGLSQAFDFLN